MSKSNGHIFISYAREDRGRVAILAKLFVDEGWLVWWDRDNLPAGQQFHRVIDQAIQDASCVLVCWSKSAIDSDWVLEEANEAKLRKKLLPIYLEEVKLPLGHRSYNCLDLSEWNDLPTHAAYQRLKAELTKRQPITISALPTQKLAKFKITRPEAYPATVQKLINRLDNPSTKPEERLSIGDELAKLGDPAQA